MGVYPETDRTMLERIISGNDIAWQDFYDTYAGVVEAICRASGVPASAVDDIVQEAMRRFADRSSHFIYMPERAKFRTYFNRIVHGAIADFFRNEAKGIVPGGEIPDVADDSLADAELEIWRRAVLDDALGELAKRVSGKNYLAFTMSVLEDHPISETAEFLGISTAQVHLARSRCAAHLRKIIAGCNEADPELHLVYPGK